MMPHDLPPWEVVYQQNTGFNERCRNTGLKLTTRSIDLQVISFTTIAIVAPERATAFSVAAATT
jgi:hypothetical protein